MDTEGIVNRLIEMKENTIQQGRGQVGKKK